MKIFDGYLIRKFLGAFFALIGMMMVIVLVVDVVEKIDTFIEKKPSWHELIFDYYINLLPFFAIMLWPMCVFLAVIFFTSRLAQRSELIPALSAGVNFYRIFGTYLAVALLLMVTQFFLKGYVLPHSIEQRMAFEYKYFRPRNISSNYNVHKKIAKDTYISIGYYDRRAMVGHRFSLEQVANGDVVRKIWATHARWQDSTQRWLLEDAHIREINGSHERLLHRKTIDTVFQLSHGDIFVIEHKESSFTNPALDEYIRQEELRGSDILAQLYEERYRRYSDPFAVLILTTIGFAMSSRKRRGGVALQIGLGVMLTFLYIAFLVVAVGIAGDGFPLWLAVWLPNILFTGVAWFTLYMAPK